MALQQKTVGETIIIYLPQSLDMVLSSAIEGELNSLFMHKSECNFIMNLRDVTIISSSGLRIFITAKRKLRTRNRDMVLCEVKNDSVMETFKISKLFDILKVFPSEDEALEYLKTV